MRTMHSYAVTVQGSAASLPAQCAFRKLSVPTCTRLRQDYSSRPPSTGTAAHPSPSRFGCLNHSDFDKQHRRNSLSPCRSSAAAAGVGIFPAGQKQARMELPALLVTVQAGMVLDSAQSPQLLADINDAVTAGATAVLLNGTDNAAELYEAAVKLKELLRERAALLLMDRLDIAAAVGAEGVVLSPTGVPVVVARKMQQGPTLLGQLVTSAAAAVPAAADGANFVLLQGSNGGFPAAADLAAARTQQRSGNAISVIAAAADTSAAAAALQQQISDLAGPVDGFCMPLSLLLPAAAAVTGSSSSQITTSEAVGALLQSLTESHSPATSGSSESSQADWVTQGPRAPSHSSRTTSGTSGVSGSSGTAGVTVKVPGGSVIRKLLNASKENLIAEERTLLQKITSLLEEVAPQMDELPLLRDSITNLDDVFLVVVVGEFNSGKSTVINALLGEKFLADGILPTTNEISVLEYMDPSNPKKQPELIQQADGLFVRRLPAALLREMRVVDTPGTNVILERQQRLTEEYVPRADLVLFVLSADRPLSESELAFLKYIRQWRKKVVFVVNKVDMLETESEVNEVLNFVASNASRLLQLDNPAVLPISGRAALKAKLECGSARKGGVLDSWEDDVLITRPNWMASRFGEFEKFIYDFLVGSEGSDSSSSGKQGGEGLRLKLQTPLYVADALMEAARVRLNSELSSAEGELSALEAVRRQLQKFKAEMSKDAEAQRQVCRNLISEAINRNNRFVDRTLQLSNIAALLGYLFGSSSSKDGSSSGPVGRNWDNEVVAGTFDQMAKQVAEHAAWLNTNCNNQREYYNSYLTQRSLPGSSSSRQQQQQPVISNNGSTPPETEASSSSSGGSAALATQDAAAAVAAASSSRSLAAVGDFKPDAARILLESEIKDAFLGTAGSAAGAQGIGLLAANMLHNSLEDLLALTIAGLASYVAVLNLPLKRSEIKAKVAKRAGNFADSVTTAMGEESDDAVDAAITKILQQVEPLEAAWQEELERLQNNEARRAELSEALKMMEKRTANLQ